MEIIQNKDEADQIRFPEPTVSSVFGHGWKTLRGRIPELILVLFVQILLSVPVGLTSVFINVKYEEAFTAGMFQVIYSLLVLMPINYGISWVYLKAVRGESFKVQDIFFAYQSFGNIILANILVCFIIGVGFMMLIVPGIIFACKLAFVPYLVMDKKMEAISAIRKSWNMTNGYTGTIFLMGIVSFFVAVCGLICFCVGIIPAVLLISLAFASIYMVVASMENPTLPPIQ